MEDIIEKLRLINYEENYCKKYNKEIISKFYFACSNNNNINSTKNRILSPRPDENNNNISPSQKIQFGKFYEICYWLINIIKQVNLLS